MPVGFSNGCAEFALKKPPPFVPISLIASWLANGPPGITWVLPSSVLTTSKPWRFWIVPRLDQHDRDDERGRERTPAAWPG